ncbi:unnamed protein product [Rotaria magnacalcarata]|uniref:Uncharacterized protein n=2 Tax=Rotaria magnacalcarata TaxID=392030 RepID=A0A816LN43_9BILA|nr:unnamed protein product [Rotaria magnacalcarata]
MQYLNKNVRACSNPEIIVGQLVSIRRIYLRQELYTISNKIQEQYKERLPALHLVSIAAYEQVFNRQPLSLPEDLRRNAIEYGLKYYKLNIEKLRKVEAQNGLLEIPDHFFYLKKKHQLNEKNMTTSDESTHLVTNQNDFMLNSTLSTTDISSSLVNTSSSTSFNSFHTNRSVTTRTTTDQSSALSKTHSREKPPKIIIRRPSNNSLTATDPNEASTQQSNK